MQGVRQQTGVLPTMDGIAVMAYPIGPGPVPANFAVVTKSGTNDYHGTAFWDYNSSALNARDFFSPAAPFRVYHNFGTSFGGPIRKDKTFFFGDYEGSREAANVVITGNTPLPAWRSGDFSVLFTNIIDPLTGAQFPGNRIPANRIHPVSQKTQDFFYPSPNFGTAGLQVGNWRGQFPEQTGFTHFNDFGVRIDQNFSNGDKVYGRVSYRQLPLTAREAVLPPIGLRDQIRGARSVVASWTHLFSPP